MKIVLLGSGNVATHLGKALKNSNHHILQVWSRNHENALALADELSASVIKCIDQVDKHADIIFICVKDEAIAEIAGQLPKTNQLIIHTSGTQTIEILRLHQFSGVIYPLQTFSKSREVLFKEVPVFFEGSDEPVNQQLKTLAQSISNHVNFADSDKRKILHVAAVFAANFSNFLYTTAQQILEDNGLSFDFIKPLIAETATKIQFLNPLDAQTGPAIRQDIEIVNSHIQALIKYPGAQELYALMSQQIVKMAKEKNG